VLFAGVAGSAACLTLLFLGMRSVMEVGGSCASGGPYLTATPCPRNVGWIVPVAIWVGLGFLALATAAAARLSLPSLAWLAWPALFLSLGWNFWEFALDPPAGDGPIWSWVVCGALFVVMGAGPLVLAVANPQDRPSALRGTRAPRAAARAADLGTRVRAATTPPPFRRPPSDADDLVDALERLAALHRAGSLSDDEYADAKSTLLGGRR
jgi:hypothetical protein